MAKRERKKDFFFLKNFLISNNIHIERLVYFAYYTVPGYSSRIQKDFMVHRTLIVDLRFLVLFSIEHQSGIRTDERNFIAGRNEN